MSPGELASAMAGHNLTLRRDLAIARGSAEVNAATVKAQQAAIRKAALHISHTLVCPVREWRGCHDCARARAWLRS